MTDTTPIRPSNIHKFLYPILGIALIFFIWLWHDTQVRDAAALKSVAEAKATQTIVDKQATVTIAQATQTLQKQNTTLQTTLQKAKTTKQQVTLINQETGTNLTYTPNPQAINPSQPSVVPIISMTPDDVSVIAKQAVDFKEAQNQIVFDTSVMASQDAEIKACNNVTLDQGKEITVLKGGSHWHKFIKATEHVAIGVGIGIIIDKTVIR